MTHRPARIIFAGGGTGGHLYPAIAMAAEVRREEPDASVSFIGNRTTIEGRVVPGEGYPFHPITVAGFRRSLSLDTIAAAGKVGVALAQSLRILRREKPDVVVGTGGYVCGPPLYAATLLGIPTLIQEQNSIPGITTRMLAKRATEVHVAFAETRLTIGREKGVYVTGNPIRQEIGNVGRNEGEKAFGLDPGVLTVLVVGGSRGARSVNGAVGALVREVPRLGCQILWAAGPQEHAEVSAALQQEPGDVRQRVRCVPYIEAMENAYAAADVAICRAGAMTIAELMQAKLPAILVPFPHAAADHQTGNARSVEQAGAAVLVPDADLPSRLLPELEELLRNGERRRRMKERAADLARPHATRDLVRAVLRLARR